MLYLYLKEHTNYNNIVLSKTGMSKVAYCSPSYFFLTPALCFQMNRVLFFRLPSYETPQLNESYSTSPLFTQHFSEFMEQEEKGYFQVQNSSFELTVDVQCFCQMLSGFHNFRYILDAFVGLFLVVGPCDKCWSMSCEKWYVTLGIWTPTYDCKVLLGIPFSLEIMMRSLRMTWIEALCSSDGMPT